MSATVLDQVRGLAADILQIDAAALTAQSSPETVGNWDSVQHLNLVLAVEDKYGLQFEPDEMDGMKSIGQIAALVESKLP